MEDEHNTDLWAIVDTGVTKYIGRITPGTDPEVGKPLTMSPFYEMQIVSIPMQAPSGEGMMLSRSVNVLPFAACNYDAKGTFLPKALFPLKDMNISDQTKYMDMIRNAKMNQEHQRTVDSPLSIRQGLVNADRIRRG
jgi:hypothetical protein